MQNLLELLVGGNPIAIAQRKLTFLYSNPKNLRNGYHLTPNIYFNNLTNVKQSESDCKMACCLRKQD